SDNPKLTDELLEKMLSIIPTAGASNEEWEVFALEMKKYDFETERINTYLPTRKITNKR
ncbi:MAG: hypothetical protein QG670_2647, partial [Thermoproteota archaeon]|nr:hypothetical protein [Thermoproteota archaeon]